MTIKKGLFFVFLILFTLPRTVCAADPRYDRLITGIKSNYADAVRYLVSQNLDVTLPDATGMTPLRLAVVSKASPEIVSLLIDGGADVNEKNPAGKSLLMEALDVNTLPDVVQVLVSRGANLNERDATGRTPLMVALENKLPLRTIMVFLNAGVDVNVADADGVTPLIQAIDADAPVAVVELLLRAGADIRLPDHKGRTAVSVEQAKRVPNTEIMNLFKQAWASLQKNEQRKQQGREGTQTVQNAAGAQPVAVASSLPAENTSSEPVSRGPRNMRAVKAAAARHAAATTASAPIPVSSVDAAPRKRGLGLLGVLLFASAVVAAGVAGLMIAARAKENKATPRPSKYTAKKMLWQKRAMKQKQKEAAASTTSDVPALPPTPVQMTPSVFAEEPALDEDDDFKPAAALPAAEADTLFAAVKQLNPDIDAVKKLLDDGADVNQKDEDGRTALTYAAEKNDTPDVIALLLERGANVNEKAKMGRTPLMFAARHNTHPEVLNALLDAGADVNAYDELDVSVLMFARNFNDNDDIATLLEAKGAKDAPYEEDAPAFTPQVMPDTTNESIEENSFNNDVFGEETNVAEPNVDETKVAETNVELPQNNAMESSLSGRVSSLRRHERKKTSRSKKEAEEFGFEEDEFRSLLKNEISKTEKARQMLARLGIDAMSRNEKLVTPLMTIAAESTQKELIGSLLEAGADINARDENGATPLMFALSRNADMEIVTALLNAGAEVNARDKTSETVLMKAVAEQNEQIVTALLEAGADVNLLTENGATALTIAAEKSEKPEIIKLLLARGADVNAVTRDGRTPLLVAAKVGKSPEVMLALIEGGADAKFKDADGKQALDYAKENPQMQNTDAYWRLNDLSF